MCIFGIICIQTNFSSFCIAVPGMWTDDHERCKKAGVPEGMTFQTKPEQALTMLRSAHEADIPFARVMCISTMSISTRFVIEPKGAKFIVSVRKTELRKLLWRFLNT